MKRYHVTYFYLATGMEGIPDERDLGMFEAEDEQDARRQAATAMCTNDPQNINWVMGCLTAKETPKHRSASIKAQRGMSFEPTDMEVVFKALTDRKAGLMNHQGWLQTPEGQTLPGAAIAVEEIEKEIVAVRNLVSKVFMHSFVG